MKMVKVKEIQTSPVIMLGEGEMLATAVKTILSKRIHNMVIVNDDQSFSILSVSDILQSASRKEWAKTPISMISKKALKLIDGEKNTIMASMAMEESDEIFGVLGTNEELTGIVSYQDITDATELSADELSEISLNSIVLRNSASTADCSEKLTDVLNDLNTSPTTCLIVLKEGIPCGIITQRDIVRLLDAGKSLDEPLEMYITSPLLTVAGDISITMALQLMQKHHYRRIIVLNDQGFLAGVVPQKAIVRILYNYAAKEEWHTCAGLNEVLQKEVELRTHELEEQQKELEYQVEQRTQELLEANTLLAKAKHVAENANMAKNIFLANMSHEIRTPMNAVLGFLELLSQTPMDQEQTRYITKSTNAANTLLSLLSDILDITKIEAGKLMIASVPFKPKELVDQCLELFEVEAKNKHLLLEHEVDANLPEYFYGDPDRIRQVIINLVSNALKFTDHGSIHVALFMHPCNAQKYSVEFIVSDTGIGISKDKQSNLFEIFTQVDNPTTRQKGGSGLGLAICKQLVEAMGGSIAVESEEGEGSTFSFILPLDIPDASILINDEQEHRFNFNDLSVLVVEDNRDNRDVAVGLLTHMGAIVDMAFNGEQAVEMIRHKSYDIVLMDVQMPIMDGVMATKIIRSEGFTALPIIALSAHASREEQQRSLFAGMNAHLNKPFKTTHLQNILLHYFPHKAIKVNNDSIVQQKCWANELASLPGLVLNNDICDYWLSKEDFFQKYEQFLHNILSESEHLHAMLEANNVSMALLLLHKLKGSVKLYGAKRLFESIEQLENSFSDDSDSVFSKAIEEYDAAVSEITGEMEKKLP